MSFRRVTASTASSATASAMTMRAVRLGGRSASTPASGSELEIDEFMRLRRREYDQHEHEVGVGEGLGRPGAHEDAVEARVAMCSAAVKLLERKKMNPMQIRWNVSTMRSRRRTGCPSTSSFTPSARYT